MWLKLFGRQITSIWRNQPASGSSSSLVTEPKSYKMLKHVDQMTQHYVEEDSNINMEFHCLRHVLCKQMLTVHNNYLLPACHILSRTKKSVKWYFLNTMKLQHFFLLSCMLFSPLILFFLNIWTIFSENKNHEYPQHTVFSSPILCPPISAGISLKTLFLKTFKPYSSHNVRDQVS